MPPRRYITLLSAFVHAAILSIVIGAQLLSVGPLPTPRTVLAFSDALPVQLKDVPLPPPPRGSARGPAEHTSADAAPIVAPRDITPETDTQNGASSHQSIDVPGVESGVVGGIELPGQGLRVEAPPAPPPAPRAPIRLHSGTGAPGASVHVSPRYPPWRRRRTLYLRRRGTRSGRSHRWCARRPFEFDSGTTRPSAIQMSLTTPSIPFAGS